jgi:hypothetical protein
MVDKTFAFCPINPDGTDKKIHEISGIALLKKLQLLADGMPPLRCEAWRAEL